MLHVYQVEQPSAGIRRKIDQNIQVAAGGEIIPQDRTEQRKLNGCLYTCGSRSSSPIERTLMRSSTG